MKNLFCPGLVFRTKTAFFYILRAFTCLEFCKKNYFIKLCYRRPAFTGAMG